MMNPEISTFQQNAQVINDEVDGQDIVNGITIEPVNINGHNHGGYNYIGLPPANINIPDAAGSYAPWPGNVTTSTSTITGTAAAASGWIDAASGWANGSIIAPTWQNDNTQYSYANSYANNNQEHSTLYYKLLNVLGSDLLHEILYHKTDNELLMIASLLDIDNVDGDISVELKKQLLKMGKISKHNKQQEKILKLREENIELAIKTKTREMEKELDKAMAMMVKYKNLYEMLCISRAVN